MPSDSDMVIESRAIVTGRVIGLSTGVDPATEFVYTFVRVELSAVLKGQITEREIVLKELGGQTENHGTLIYGTPRFERDQEVLLYLDTWPDGSLRVHQGFLGKFDISLDKSTGGRRVERQVEGEEVLIVAGSANNGTNRSELGAYLQMVARLMSANRSEMRQFERQYYSEIPLRALPIGFDASTPGLEINPQFTLLNPTSPSRWFEADSSQSVVFYVNPAGAPAFADVAADMQAAMDAWANAGGSIRLTIGGQSSGCGVYVADGVNNISFNNCDNYFSPSQSCSGLIAVAGIIRFAPNEIRNVGGISYSKAVEANMSFNPYALCNFTNRAQLQEVATHELGHALGLGHSAVSSATMAAYVHFDNRGASLMPDDIQGITSIYPGRSSSGPLNIMTSDLPLAIKDSDYSMNLQASGGSGGYSWSYLGGQLPTGTQLAASGFLFGKPNALGAFSFVAQVRDSSGTISQRSMTLTVELTTPGPMITSVEYRKKKVFVYGNNFQDGAMVYVDGEGISATLSGSRLATEKKKQKVGSHVISVANPDGKQSNTFQLVIQ